MGKSIKTHTHLEVDVCVCVSVCACLCLQMCVYCLQIVLGVSVCYVSTTSLIVYSDSEPNATALTHMLHTQTQEVTNTHMVLI